MNSRLFRFLCRVLYHTNTFEVSSFKFQVFSEADYDDELTTEDRTQIKVRYGTYLYPMQQK